MPQLDLRELSRYMKAAEYFHLLIILKLSLDRSDPLEPRRCFCLPTNRLSEKVTHYRIPLSQDDGQRALQWSHTATQLIRLKSSNHVPYEVILHCNWSQATLALYHYFWEINAGRFKTSLCSVTMEFCRMHPFVLGQNLNFTG